ncbi:MAG: asparagine--tRNA ligase [Firmicutes bacterium]|nr:asparagine--tRNA ligase [Bacillota bacterium]
MGDGPDAQVVPIAEIRRHAARRVTVRGWLYNRRSSGKIQFFLVRDGTGVIQCVAARDRLSEQEFTEVERLGQESSLSVTGIPREDHRAPGGYELTVSEVVVISEASDYPITPKEHGVDFLMDHRHLWLRSRRQHAVLRVRASLMRACRDYFDTHGFTLVDAPILTPSACEGTSTLFETDYFGDKAYLTQSGQLYMEAAAMALGKVYCFGPTFRAEKSKTRRHLAEFWMIEPEVAFADLEDVMRLAEDFLSFVVGRVLEERAAELELLERDPAPLRRVSPPFPRLPYDEAVRKLKELGEDIEWGMDFGGAHETVLCQGFSQPVFVHRYPAAAKAFYMKPDPTREEVALSVDLLAPEGYGEIIGGGQRIDNLALLERRVEEHGLDRDAYKWYLDLRRYGSVPHSGFGMGIERALAWICGLPHVRETIPFPRLLTRMYP